ncbi:MAG: endonuclease/exonuclease/phosphatase family protein [Polyangiaceae bacterium]
MKPFLALLAALAVACDGSRLAIPTPSASTEPSSAPALPPRDLVVASFNVLYENAREGPGGDEVDPETIAAIAALRDADVIAFQETNPPFERAIRAALRESHPNCAFHAPTRYSPGGLGFCVRSALRIEEERVIDSPVTWFPAQRATLGWGATRLELLNVHLRPAIGAREAWWQANASTIADRDTEMRAYLAELDKGAPTLIVGDFNDPNHGGVVSTLDRAGYASALGTAHVDTPTWRWAGEPPLEVQLDHVVIQPSTFDVLRGEVRHIGRSDHFPIVAWLRERR